MSSRNWTPDVGLLSQIQAHEDESQFPKDQRPATVYTKPQEITQLHIPLHVTWFKFSGFFVRVGRVISLNARCRTDTQKTEKNLIMQFALE